MRRYIGLVTILSTILVLSSCQVPTSTSSPSNNSSSTGSLTINIPSVAKWITASSSLPQISATGVAGSQSGTSRALLYATSVTISLTTSSGSNVISPVTQQLSTTASSTQSSASLSQITNIPVGTYTVTVSVYNSVYSTYYPTVTGSASVTIAANTNTTAQITCLPYSTNSLTPNVVTTASLIASSEKWYTLSTLANLPYTVSQGGAGTIYTCVFDSLGNYLGQATSSTPYVIGSSTSAASTYYIGIAVGSTATTSSLEVTANLPPVNEGSVAAPVVLTVDPTTDHSFTLGASGAPDQTSYYQFTTTTAGNYALVIDSAHAYFTLNFFSNSAYTNSIASIGYQSMGYVFQNLAASTTYYMELTDDNPSDSTGSLKIVSPATIAAAQTSEGSPALPVALTLGSAHSGKTGTHVYDAESYYTFTTGSSQPNLLVSLSNLVTSDEYFSVLIGTDSTFKHYTASNYGINSSATFILLPNTTYYLAVLPYFTTNYSYPEAENSWSYTLTLTGSTPTVSVLPLSNTSYTAGNLPSTNSQVWYEVDVAAGGGLYDVQWNDNFQGNLTFSGQVLVSIYHQDWTPYSGDTGLSYGYTVPTSITVPSTDSKFYIAVTPFNYGTFGIEAYHPSVGSLTLTVQ